MTFRRTLTTPLMAMVLAAIAATCGGEVGETVAGSYAKDVLVDTDWVEAHMNDADVRLVEVGSGVEGFEEGHIPGASFLSLGRLSNPDAPIRGQIATAEGVSATLSTLGIERDQTVVFYDDRNNLPSARAYWVLKYYQHAQVRIYNGGKPKWIADGGALSTETSESEISGYEAGPADPRIRTTWQYVVDHTDDPSTLFCDARAPDEHLGRNVRAARGGHIPGSINVEWTAAVAPDGTFKSADALAQLYGDAGFTSDKEIITYCQSGLRGAHTWFVLSELLGYANVRNYDGSWAEYGNNPASPIES